MSNSLFHQFSKEYNAMRKVERERARQVREDALAKRFLHSSLTQRGDEISRESRPEQDPDSSRVIPPGQAKKIRSDLAAAISQVARSGPHPPPSMQVRQLFDKSLDYSSGTPNPVYLLNTITGQQATSKDNVFVQTLANPVNGEISLAFVGGNFFDLLGNITHSVPMPERWEFGDAITASGSLFYLHDVGPSAQPPGSILNVSAAFYSPNEDLNPQPPTVFSDPADPLNGIYQCMDVEPGQPPASIGAGYVAATAHLALTVTLFGNQGIVATNSENLTVLERTETRTVPGGPTSPINLLSREWLLAKPHQTQGMGVTLPFESIDIRQVVVEAEVGIAGYRFGVNDPEGGGIGLTFLQDGPVVSSSFTFSPACPFIVANMEGYIYSPKV